MPRSDPCWLSSCWLQPSFLLCFSHLLPLYTIILFLLNPYFTPMSIFSFKSMGTFHGYFHWKNTAGESDVQSHLWLHMKPCSIVRLARTMWDLSQYHPPLRKQKLWIKDFSLGLGMEFSGWSSCRPRRKLWAWSSALPKTRRGSAHL